MMAESTHVSNLVGAIVANVSNFLLTSLFIARLYNKPRVEYWLGIIFIASIVPLAYLLVTAIGAKRPPLYFIQVGLMMTFVVVELMLDYVFKVEFRQTQWMVILYVTLFFAATGGMIGVASHAGKLWAMGTIISFLIMGSFSFAQHFITGE